MLKGYEDKIKETRLAQHEKVPIEFFVALKQ